jgi:hypothetical protein
MKNKNLRLVPKNNYILSKVFQGNTINVNYRFRIHLDDVENIIAILESKTDNNKWCQVCPPYYLADIIRKESLCYDLKNRKVIYPQKNIWDDIEQSLVLFQIVIQPKT